MSSPSQSPVAFEFDGFRFEPADLRMTHGGRTERLTVKAAETLLVLVQRPNTVVTKQELLSAVWPDVSVEENNLNQQISVLRKLLRREGAPDLIETVPRRGFRFIGNVHAIPVPVSEPGLPTHDHASVTQPSIERFHLHVPARALAILVVLAALLGAAAVSQRSQRSHINASSRGAQERAEALLKQGNAQGAVSELQEAIRLDPTNAEAYGSLAYALHKFSWHSAVSVSTADSPPLAAAKRSVELDPQCAGCHGILGFVLTYHHWKWAEAEKHFRESIRLDPDRESTRPSFAMLLAATGRVPEALQQIDSALIMRPYELTWLTMRATFLYLDRRYEEARAAADRALQINDGDRGAWEWKSRALFKLGRGPEAIQAVAQGLFPQSARELELAVTQAGSEGGLRKLLEITDDWKARSEQSWRRAPWRALLGNVEGALDELEDAYQQRNFNLIYVAVDPVYDPIRTHPRFQQLLADMGLPDKAPLQARP
jgi:DNA-binding winged helix-turn-helix (wHTH) protein/Flp pilus assembly protein TadD